MSNVDLGREAEEKSVKYLESKGYAILKRNYAVRGGEIDIIAKDGVFTVFVEVKLRNSLEFGTGAEAVNKRKRSLIVKTALNYAYKEGIIDTPMRFDIIEITKREGKYFVRHIINAFSAN